MSLVQAIDSSPVATEQLLRRFIEGISDYAVFMLDRSGNILTWNAGAERVKGYRTDEIVGRHFSCFYTGEDIVAEKPARALKAAEQRGSFDEIGLRIRKDGSQFIAYVVISAIRDESGELQGFGKITRDITARVELQKRIRTSEEKLQNLISTVLDTIVDGVITINRQGAIQSYNKACQRLFGHTFEEVIGKNVRMLMAEPYRSEHDGYIENYHRTGVAKIIGMDREVVGQRKDGSTFPMELSVGETREGGDHAFVGIIRDISERYEAEKAREQLRQAQKMEALGQLTGGIAHDFNNLLAIIIGNLDLLTERSKEDPDIREFLEPSLAAALRGSELTQRLLAFGRKQALQPKIIAINDLLSRFSRLVRRTFDERIDITVAAAPDLWPARADPSQLEDVLLNLSVNARDAMPSGGKLIFETKNVVLDEDYAADNAEVVAGGYVMIAVSDSGNGMTPEVIARAFEPFFTTKETGRGSGLGLSMVYGFVKQSAGHIKIYSEAGYGTSIRIYLPRADGMGRLVAEDEASPAAERLRTGKLVLVVEDNPDVLKLTSAMVENLGYAVLTSATGEEALANIARHPHIDLLLTDVMLTGAINGPVLAQRAVAIQPQLKVLFNSGYAEQAIFERGLLRRGVNLIGKPFRKQQLAQKILEVLSS